MMKIETPIPEKDQLRITLNPMCGKDVKNRRVSQSIKCISSYLPDFNEIWLIFGKA